MQILFFCVDGSMASLGGVSFALAKKCKLLAVKHDLAPDSETSVLRRRALA